MKKWIIITILFIFSGICVFSSGGGLKKPWGNNDRNIQATQEISKVAGIRKLSVLSHGDTVLVGIETLEGADRDSIKKYAERTIQKYFQKYSRCLLGVDNKWADAVLELPFYIDGGMNRQVIEKRFQYLAQMGESKIQQNLTN